MNVATFRRSAVAAVLVAGSLGAGVLTAPSAAARNALGAVQVYKSSPSDVLNYKGVTVYCPTGKKVVAAGATIHGATGHVILTAVVPGPTLTSVFVSGQEDETAPNEFPYQGTWRITAFASCAAQLSGQVRIYASSARNSSDKSATAYCPAGKKVLGLGGDIQDGLGDVLMGSLVPSTDLTSVTVIARENDSIATGWSVRAYAICSYPPIGLRMVSALSAFNSLTPKVLTVTCPTGLGVISAAGAAPVVGPIPYDVGLTEMVWSAVQPTAKLTAEEHDPYGAYWVLAGYAICSQIL